MQGTEKPLILDIVNRTSANPLRTSDQRSPAALAKDPSGPAGSQAYRLAIFRGSNAAASLKRPDADRHQVSGGHIFRGSNAAASLKRASPTDLVNLVLLIFRGSMPRPH
jgi:hypothetical protein